MLPWDRLVELARTQGGALRTADGRQLGISRQTLTEKARRERWPRPAPGIVLLPGTPDDPSTWAWVAVLRCGAPGWLDGRSALWVHGLAPTAPRRVELLLPAGRRAPDDARLHVARSTTIAPHDVTVVDGLPVVSVARALLAVASRTPRARLEDLLVVAVQRRTVTLDAVVDVCARAGRRAGVGRLRGIATRLQQDPVDSGLERRTRDVLAGAGLRPAPGPWPARTVDPDGTTRILHVDVAFPEPRVAVECDGVLTHSRAGAFERDRRRWPALQAAGWLLVWSTHARLRDDPDGLVAEVERALAGRVPPA